MSINPREAAVTALYKIENDGAYLNKATLDVVQKCESRDKAFVNELVMGTVRNKLYLDFVIQSYSKIKLKKLSPWVLAIMRTAVYQLVCMDKIPPSAACNEAVKLASKYAHKAARGFVNGVLRSISRELDSLPKPKGSAAERMSVIYSCPLWLTEKLISQFGEKISEGILKDSLIPHPTTVRVNTIKTTPAKLCELLEAEGIDAEIYDEEVCLKINGAIDVKRSECYKNGYYTLQNINSIRAALTLEPQKGETVIDVCAAPGGKTTHIAELMKDNGKVIAFDVHPHKIELIQNAAKRLGLSCVETKCHNSEEVCSELIGKADRVLADVPCSGIGVIHKKPDIKYNRSVEDIQALCEIQSRILRSAAEYAKPGGVLVYSTCTILKEENEEQIKSFLAENSEFVLESEKLYLADKTGGSGFYICRMRKN